jgi:ABC-type Fe3+-hydroxamate transport system substrate-binding protein
MRTLLDQMHREVLVPEHPVRIVSLVPSQTELLADLGLADRVVGITRFCVHPRQWFLEKPRVGGTKDASLKRIAALQPDLIIANKEENTQEIVERCSALAPVWVSDIQNLADALQIIAQVGALTQKEVLAQEIHQKIKVSFADLKPVSKPLKVAYLIWKNPWMAASGATFIGDMLRRLGLENVFEHATQRYPSFELNDPVFQQAEVVLLSSEPYPFKVAHIATLQATLPKARILLVDGELFSWYGSRLVKSAGYFKTLQQALF